MTRHSVAEANFRPDIEGLRAVAILLVIAAHGGLIGFEGGFVGVDVFFVLSGFLITGLLSREVLQMGRIDFIRFYARRMKRLLPSLLAMIVVTSAIAAICLAPIQHQEQSASAVTAALWVSNFHFVASQLDYFGAGAENNLFLHTWSLGVEEQFYLVWPAVVMYLFAAWKFQGARSDLRRLKNGLIWIVILSLACSVWMTHIDARLAFYLMPFRAWQFAFGGLLALISINRHSSDRFEITSRSRSHLIDLLGWAGMAMILISAVLINPSQPYPGTLALLPSVGAAAVIYAGAHSSRTGVGRPLEILPMRFIGRISYSWYLWHWPVLVLGGSFIATSEPANRMTLVGFSFVIATVFYLLLERPVRRYEQLMAWPGLVLGVSAMVMTATALGAWFWGQRSIDWSHDPRQARFQEVRADLPAIYKYGCDTWFHNDETRLCTFGDDSAPNTAIAMGDSVGLQWFPALHSAYTRPGWRLIVLTKSACPMANAPIYYPLIGRFFTECESWREKAMQRVIGLKPDILVLGSADSYAFTPEEWRQGTSSLLAQASTAASHVIVIRSTPLIPFDGPQCLANDAWRVRFHVPTHHCEATSFASSDVYGWQTESARPFDNVSMLDLNDLVCPDGTCAAKSASGVVVFRDNRHLTQGFVESIAMQVGERLDENVTTR